jgi:hypothetical protein
VGAIILSIKMAAISIAIAVTMLLIYGYEFRWYTAFAFGGVGVRRLHRGWLGGLPEGGDSGFRSHSICLSPGHKAIIGTPGMVVTGDSSSFRMSGVKAALVAFAPYYLAGGCRWLH